jgi:hypothetical protein
MITLEELKEALSEKMCDKRHRIVGLVEPTRSREERVLRKLNAMGSFQPIAYERELLVFFLVNGTVTIDKSKSIPLRVNMVVLTDDYNDLARIIESLDEYDFLPLDLTFGSEEIYDKYFDFNIDKPFQGYAFELGLNIRVSYKDLLITQ